MLQTALPACPPSRAVRIVEVGPRDGLQSIKTVVPTATKIELIERLSRTGLSTIEATSFVSPRWVPQLSDGAAVMHGIGALMHNSIAYPVLVPNVQGLEAAARVGVREIAVFVSASEGFSGKNINCSIAESLSRVQGVVNKALLLGIRIRAYISCIFDCPYDGPTDPCQVLLVTNKLLSMGCYEVSLGDTLGAGSPTQVVRLLTLLLEHVPATRLAAHFHDTYGQAVANAVAAYELGIRTFDSSVAGLGGCPYSPGAKGNLATEDIVYTFHQMNVPTGIDLDALVNVGQWITSQIGIPNNSRAGLAICSKFRLEPSGNANSIDGAHSRLDPLPISAEYRTQRDKSRAVVTPNYLQISDMVTTSKFISYIKLFTSWPRESTVYHTTGSSRSKSFWTNSDFNADNLLSKVRHTMLEYLRALF